MLLPKIIFFLIEILLWFSEQVNKKITIVGYILCVIEN